MKFIIEQIALNPPDAPRAVELLIALGLNEWAADIVHARGVVFDTPAANTACLAFNYQAAPSKPLELEVLQYEAGRNWMENYPVPSVSHLGMHCTEDELSVWKAKMRDLGITIAQEVNTVSHTNPVIAGQRWYQYTIFNTRMILGVDLKFIVRKNAAPVSGEAAP